MRRFGGTSLLAKLAVPFRCALSLEKPDYVVMRVGVSIFSVFLMTACEV